LLVQSSIFKKKYFQTETLPNFVTDEEALLKVDLQEIFDLSFDQMNNYSKIQAHCCPEFATQDFLVVYKSVVTNLQQQYFYLK
jgi:hypothetical protein